MPTILRRSIRLFATGFSMGIADLIPGVSGGTIAFLSGIYEELLHSIKVVTGKTLRLTLQGKFTESLRSVPIYFLLPLGAGILAAIFSLASVLTWLFEHYPVFLWAFFFGLVLASVYVVLKRIQRWDATDKIMFLIAAVAAYFLVGLTPVESPNTLPLVFASGMIAICAMILPGISGSFILLLLGKYQQVLNAVHERDFLLLAVFAAGCAVGLALFTRLLSWLFSRHHDISVAVLAGFMLGSLRKIWPWKETVQTRINSHGIEVPLIEKNVLPDAFDPSVLGVLLLGLAGIMIVLYLDHKKVVKEHTQDIEDRAFEESHRQALKNQ